MSASASEAAIVMLSVIYAMTGGVILQWALGYNFSVAVWVGYIALYGVAVQTESPWSCTCTRRSTTFEPG
jgi:Cu/Ag efflux pump CusA